MKRNLMIILIVSLFFTFTSCNTKKYKELSNLNYSEASQSVGAGNYLIDEQEAKKMMKNFRSKFRNCDDETGTACNPTNMNDSLSKSVWMSREALMLLFSQIITDNKIDGLRFYLGAYETKSSINPAPGQYYNNQVSVIIVPTTYGTSFPHHKSNHKDDWNFFHSFLLEQFKKETIKMGGGFNHGELCPDSCQ